ncbi:MULTISPECIES: DUF2200 family protein [Staphylococcus]|jgi:hypothetical protein|nr:MULTISPECIES: DUF2200 family protein [Staphylococcus]MDR5650038.1 DUF2200 family protein [Staphylococcus nepalensis]MDW8552145.1 DUF2200 family protein [Staphylococcus nepalensis]WQL20999.1 DUF2200 family protein [Staphylococcus nepalensis]GGB93791.1 hypothetical protein GCM10007203_26100 [Staphylococcus nepalensis]
MTKPNIYNMKFGKVYPHLVRKAKKKGRTQDGVNEIIHWMTGYTKRN